MTRQDIALAIERLRVAGAPPLLIDALRAWHTAKVRREAQGCSHFSGSPPPESKIPI